MLRRMSSLGLVGWEKGLWIGFVSRVPAFTTKVVLVFAVAWRDFFVFVEDEKSAKTDVRVMKVSSELICESIQY